jgi:hypothetical protein
MSSHTAVVKIIAIRVSDTVAAVAALTLDMYRAKSRQGSR